MVTVERALCQFDPVSGTADHYVCTVCGKPMYAISTPVRHCGSASPPVTATVVVQPPSPEQIAQKLHASIDRYLGGYREDTKQFSDVAKQRAVVCASCPMLNVCGRCNNKFMSQLTLGNCERWSK